MPNALLSKETPGLARLDLDQPLGPQVALLKAEALKQQPSATRSRLNEKCGVLGICTRNTQALGHLLYFGLYALQHRGQESCGMAVFDNDFLSLHKQQGLVSQVFSEDDLQKLQGQVGVGHTRYATTGDRSQENSQPVVCRSTMGSLVLGHNGNLINLERLREHFNLEASDGFGANSDSHVMARCIAQALALQKRQSPSSSEGTQLLAACQAVFEQCEGAFSVVVAAGDRLIAARDRKGIRPLCLGRIEPTETRAAAWVVASETCALDIVGAQYVRDVRPGEVFVARFRR
jgi:amidophosphoribosyltransferase